MKFTQINKVARFSTLFFFAMLFIVFQSCKKSGTDIGSGGETMLKVKLSVGSPKEENILFGNSKTTKRSAESNVQLSSVKISDGISMDVMVIKDGNNATLSAASSALGDAKAATQPVVKVLDPGVKYRVVVYDEDGAHKGNYDYAYGNEATTPGIPLNNGATYTFIVYSVNSTSTLPNITDQGSLSTASLNDISSELMYFKKTMTLTFGETNLLEAELIHQFSQITTTIEMDNSMTGNIHALSGNQITPTKASGSIKFSNNLVSFPATSNSTNVAFPAITPGIRSITSTPTFLISPATTTANFNIGSITLDGETKTNISVPDIKITPGHRYNLVLKFRVCTQNVTSDGLNWRYPEESWEVRENRKWVTYKGIIKDGIKYPNNSIITNQFLAPQANYGFQFDITELDNAFNMKVNDNYIFGTSANQQIQFQTNNLLGTVRNIEFIDGTEYSQGGIDEVYNLVGTTQNPLIRILISRNGEVTILGSKTNGGPLMQMRLKNGQSFNPVIWKSTDENKVIVSQKVDGRTIVIGRGYGRKRIACPKN
ncbi:hypothetical protein [Sphingobacterium sp. 1.A.5]|jgi:hypothetical protein|uniref:hypothetical protein n=1 Tax=Sphingobacterium sp. 1.A.5 TaxID=2044604 RepID=UPI000C0BE3B6|nr:hypothetical protein [Sphingobacterium sp. 1.A.5]